MWQLFFYQIFLEQLLSIKAELQKIRAKDPERLKGHPKAILYLDLIRVISEIRKDPSDARYRPGGALGDHTDWKRAKAGLPDRYRLFFKYFSKSSEIFIAWINDENTLRTKGAKNDCYVIFQRMLDRGDVPSSREALSQGSHPGQI